MYALHCPALRDRAQLLPPIVVCVAVLDQDEKKDHLVVTSDSGSDKIIVKTVGRPLMQHCKEYIYICYQSSPSIIFFTSCLRLLLHILSHLTAFFQSLRRPIDTFQFTGKTEWEESLPE